MTSDPTFDGDRALDRAVSEALESMAFVDAVRVPAGQGSQGPNPTGACGATIALLSPVQGTLRLALSRGEAATLSDMAWGAAGDGGTDANRDQFLFELANIVAGRYLGLAHPDAPVILGFPEPFDTWPDDQSVVAYEAEGMTLFVGVAR